MSKIKRRDILSINVVSPSELTINKFNSLGEANIWLNKLIIYLKSMQDVDRICLVHIDENEAELINFSSINAFI